MNSKEASDSAYKFKEIEEKWIERWFKDQIFDTKIAPDKAAFSVALPPPNITGNLHMGHALNGTLQDVLVRLKRMQGFNVLWQPGTDHAGIATQMVVERQLKKQGINRHELGREKFIEQVWVWRNQYGDAILNQYKRLGVSFAWDRVAFTMDPSYVKAIYRAFVILHREGFIYRGKRITNWCPRCQTSVSDLEVEHVETHGHLYFVKYPLLNSNNSVIVATVRPESMFGDVAIAVHPEDERHKNIIGKKVRLPLTQRELPVIADRYVEREFGTGALKITPAHDLNDWEIGQRHNLSTPVTIDSAGKLCGEEFVASRFLGVERFQARKAIVEELQADGFIQEIKDYTHNVAHCERCGTVIEPYLSEQWYVSMKDLAKPAIKEVEDGNIKFIPERYAATYLDWMKNIRDWNISRQLWWGHRIPIWTCANGHEDAYETLPQKCSKCDSKQLQQDPDVLDTWFSSGLWPFATLGWPDKTPELATFYPTTILSTAREIINLWVSRMIFMSLKLIGSIPFENVLIHPVIQTVDGKRMSKSKGNAIDPLDMIDQYGADANRFWFTSVGVKGDQDVRFQDKKLEESKRFVNKLWNAGKFVLSQLEGLDPSIVLQPNKLSLADQWILHRYSTLIEKLKQYYNEYDFQLVAKAIYEFSWDDFCDWYLEIAKIQLQSSEAKEQTQVVLQHVFSGLLKLLHPIMPFITEELSDRLSIASGGTGWTPIMNAAIPAANANLLNEKAEEQMTLLIKIIRSIRNIRQTYNIPMSSEAEAYIDSQDSEERELVASGKTYVERLARVKIKEQSDTNGSSARTANDIVSATNIRIPLDSLIDVEKTKAKLLQRKQSLEKDLSRVHQTFDSQDFQQKAPPEKIQNLKIQLEELKQQMDNLEQQLRVVS